MINLFINLFTYGFDLFILLTYMDNILAKRHKQLSALVFWGAYVFTEIILYVNQILTAFLPEKTGIYITNIVSFSTTFALTLLYRSSLLSKIYTALSFQLLAVISEYIFTMIIYLIQPEIFQPPSIALNAPMNLGSKVVLFLLAMVVSFLFGKGFRFMHKSYQILLFTTPVASLLIMIFTPLKNIVNGNNQSFFLCIYICLSLLNIVNYILLNFSYHQTEEIFRLKQMERLSAYQQEKYVQLSSAYKSNRSLIHDTKKHYFIIKKYLENKEYPKLDAYLDIAIKDLENTYTEVNTGNLVIDSFVSNYKNVCQESQIIFSTNLCVDPNRIPINNYDLCIVLGNLLDNAINACKKNTCVQNHIELTITSNNNDLFYIHIKNTYNRSMQSNDSQPTQDPSFIPQHGYGLNNIRSIAEKNHATLNIHCEDFFVVDIVFPVIDVQMRILKDSHSTVF